MQGAVQQRATIQARLPIVAIFLIAMAAYLIIHLANFQFFPRSVRQELERIGSSITNTTLRIPAERGLIYDRDGEPMAYNIVQYRLGVSPDLVADPDTLSKEVATILDIEEFEIYRKLYQRKYLGVHCGTDIGRARAGDRGAGRDFAGAGGDSAAILSAGVAGGACHWHRRG